MKRRYRGSAFFLPSLLREYHRAADRGPDPSLYRSPCRADVAGERDMVRVHANHIALQERAEVARCNVGVGWVEKSTAKGASLLRTSGLLFPPLRRGG